MTARCRHARTVVVDGYEVCLACGLCRVEGTRRWSEPLDDAVHAIVATAIDTAAARTRALPPGQRRDVELRVRLRPAEIDALDALAARRGVSRSDAVREALRYAARSDAVREVLRHAAIQTT